MEREFVLVPGSETMVSISTFDGVPVLKLAPEALTLLASTAFHEIEFKLRPAHNAQVGALLRDPASSENDRFVALSLLRNAAVAVDGVLPLCQDTGTAIIHAWKGQQVWTGGGDEAALAEGVRLTYAKDNLRYSQNRPLSTYEEVNTGNNLPAEIDIEACDGMEYRFLCVAKGGGSANKTQLFQQTKAILKPEKLVPFLTEKIEELGTSACPPYHISIVIGGTSAEMNLKTVKLVSCGYATEGLRDVDLEAELLAAARASGIGAQFGGIGLAHDVRVVRLPRHGASCPIGIGVSCSADRNIECRIDREGIWVERLDDNPIRWAEGAGDVSSEGVTIDLDRPMAEILASLAKCPVGSRLSLDGTVIIARDIAHARFKERLDRGDGLPDYLKKHPVMYAGPAKTPAGMPCGSLGPTTAGRMDSYVDEFQRNGASLVMIAKGPRGKQVADACRINGGFYLGTLGGAAALLARNHIVSLECIDYSDLGMEAVYLARLRSFPAFRMI